MTTTAALIAKFNALFRAAHDQRLNRRNSRLNRTEEVTVVVPETLRDVLYGPLRATFQMRRVDFNFVPSTDATAWGIFFSPQNKARLHTVYGEGGMLTLLQGISYSVEEQDGMCAIASYFYTVDEDNNIDGEKLLDVLESGPGRCTAINLNTELINVPVPCVCEPDRDLVYDGSPVTSSSNCSLDGVHLHGCGVCNRTYISTSCCSGRRTPCNEHESSEVLVMDEEDKLSRREWIAKRKIRVWPSLRAAEAMGITLTQSMMPGSPLARMAQSVIHEFRCSKCLPPKVAECDVTLRAQPLCVPKLDTIEESVIEEEVVDVSDIVVSEQAVRATVTADIHHVSEDQISSADALDDEVKELIDPSDWYSDSSSAISSPRLPSDHGNVKTPSSSLALEETDRSSQAKGAEYSPPPSEVDSSCYYYDARDPDNYEWYDEDEVFNATCGITEPDVPEKEDAIVNDICDLTNEQLEQMLLDAGLGPMMPGRNVVLPPSRSPQGDDDTWSTVIPAPPQVDDSIPTVVHIGQVKSGRKRRKNKGKGKNKIKSKTTKPDLPARRSITLADYAPSILQQDPGIFRVGSTPLPPISTSSTPPPIIVDDPCILSVGSSIPDSGSEHTTPRDITYLTKGRVLDWNYPVDLSTEGNFDWVIRSGFIHYANATQYSNGPMSSVVIIDPDSVSNTIKKPIFLFSPLASLFFFGSGQLTIAVSDISSEIIQFFKDVAPHAYYKVRPFGFDFEPHTVIELLMEKSDLVRNLTEECVAWDEIMRATVGNGECVPHTILDEISPCVISIREKKLSARWTINNHSQLVPACGVYSPRHACVASLAISGYELPNKTDIHTCCHRQYYFPAMKALCQAFNHCGVTDEWDRGAPGEKILVPGENFITKSKKLSA